jgi:hypothetical protein
MTRRVKWWWTRAGVGLERRLRLGFSLSLKTFFLIKKRDGGSGRI